jgi:hypothetical protein
MIIFPMDDTILVWRDWKGYKCLKIQVFVTVSVDYYFAEQMLKVFVGLKVVLFINWLDSLNISALKEERKKWYVDMFTVWRTSLIT